MARTTMHIGLPALSVRVLPYEICYTGNAGRVNTLTAAMLKLNRLGILGGSLRCQRTLLQRSFALSRLPDKNAPSGGRTRPRIPTPRARPTPGAHHDSQQSLAQDESTANTSDSPLWEESQRKPSSDPEDGLKRLLQNNTLTVTRSVA